MKKALLGLAALAAVSSASAASVGGYFGTGAGFGVYYQTDRTATSNMRYGLNLLELFGGGSLSVGGEVAYLNDINGSALAGLNPYYGLGLGATVSLGANTGVAAYPHGLLGLRYNVAGPFTVFGEVNAGPTLALGTGNLGLGFGFGARLGLDYQLR